jgi:hypothetical protein
MAQRFLPLIAYGETHSFLFSVFASDSFSKVSRPGLTFSKPTGSCQYLAVNLLEVAMTFKDWLARSGKSVVEVAEAAGVTRQAVYKWLSGDSQPSLARMRVLVTYSDGEINVMMFGDDDDENNGVGDKVREGMERGRRST